MNRLNKTILLPVILALFFAVFLAPDALAAWREEADITNLYTNQIEPINPGTTMTIGGSGDTVTITGTTGTVQLPLGAFKYYVTSPVHRDEHNDLNILTYNNTNWHVWTNGQVNPTPLEAKFQIPDNYSSNSGVFKVLLLDSQSTYTTKPSIAFKAYRMGDGTMPTGGSTQTAVAVDNSPDEATCTVLTDVTPAEAADWISVRFWPSWGSSTGNLYFGGAVFEFTAQH